MKKTFACSVCGSEDLEFESHAKWSVAKQEFEYTVNNFYFVEERSAVCEKCECLTQFVEKPAVEENKQTYKVYKVTIEKEFVIAAPAELSILEVEKTVDNIITIHVDNMLREPLAHIVAEEIKTLADIPAGWEADCLPYTNYRINSTPKELINKTIAEYLADGTN
jgi:hypothetical protein